MPSLFSWTINADLQSWFRTLPGVVQFVVVLVTADIMEYATHRAMHEVPVLWRFHAVHHSVERMDWMAGSRLHFLEPVVTRMAVMLPAFILGASDTPLLCYIVWAGFSSWARPLEFRIGVWAAEIRGGHTAVSPLAPRQRQGSDRHQLRRSPANLGPAVRNLPHARGSMAGAVCVVGNPLPKGMWRQFLYPFQRTPTNIVD